MQKEEEKKRKERMKENKKRENVSQNKEKDETKKGRVDGVTVECRAVEIEGNEKQKKQKSSKEKSRKGEPLQNGVQERRAKKARKAGRWDGEFKAVMRGWTEEIEKVGQKEMERGFKRICKQRQKVSESRKGRRQSCVLVK